MTFTHNFNDLNSSSVLFDVHKVQITGPKRNAENERTPRQPMRSRLRKQATESCWHTHTDASSKSFFHIKTREDIGSAAFITLEVSVK